jgi:hypothetical protein
MILLVLSAYLAVGLFMVWFLWDPDGDLETSVAIMPLSDSLLVLLLAVVAWPLFFVLALLGRKR